MIVPVEELYGTINPLFDGGMPPLPAQPAIVPLQVDKSAVIEMFPEGFKIFTWSWAACARGLCKSEKVTMMAIVF